MGIEELMQVGQAVTVEGTDSSGAGMVFEGMSMGAVGRNLSFSLAPADDTEAIQAGSEVRIRWGHDRGMSYFSARVLELKEGNRLRLTVEKPGDVERTQRRRFMRLEVHLPFRCTRLDATGQPQEVLKATTLEIGGNGATFVADRALNVGERVAFDFDLEGWGRCNGIGVVKRSVLALTPERAEHRVGMQFTEVKSTTQAIILSFLLAQKNGARPRPGFQKGP